MDEATVMQELIDERSVEIQKVTSNHAYSAVNYFEAALSKVIHLLLPRPCFTLQVHKGIVEINEMFADLSKIVKAQQVC